MDFNNNDAQDLIEIIRKVVKQEIDNLNLEYPFFGKIVKINANGTYNVEIPMGGGTYPNLTNKTNITLKLNDSVVVKVQNKNFSNAYIAMKNG